MGRVGDRQCNTFVVWDLQAVTWTMLLKNRHKNSVQIAHTF